MNMPGKEYAGAAYGGEAKESPRSPFDNLTSAVENLEKVKAQLRALADRLVGSEPRDVANFAAQGTVAIPCLLDGLDHSASVVRSLAGDIMNDIVRIERRL